jgi:hypothetical protein
VPASGYTMAAFPTREQLQSHRDAGRGGPPPAPGSWHNAGYAEGSYAVATLDDLSFRPGDCLGGCRTVAEPSALAGGIPRGPGREPVVITGLFRALADAGYSYGIYTNPKGGGTSPGNWWLPGIPAWATAGARGLVRGRRNSAVDGGPPGGPVGWPSGGQTPGTTNACSGYPDQPPIPRPPVGDGEFTGDWEATCRGSAPSTAPSSSPRGLAPGRWGNRPICPGPPGPRWTISTPCGSHPGRPPRPGGPTRQHRQTVALPPVDHRLEETCQPGHRLGKGNADHSRCRRPDRDGRPRPGALNRHSGNLWLYPGTGGTSPYLASRVRIRRGWQSADQIFAPGDSAGTGFPDCWSGSSPAVLAVHRQRSGRAVPPDLAGVRLGGHGCPGLAR